MFNELIIEQKRSLNLIWVFHKTISNFRRSRENRKEAKIASQISSRTMSSRLFERHLAECHLLE